MERMEKDVAFALYVLTLGLIFIFNFNLIGALIVKDWQWILDNWICGESMFILPIGYLLLHISLAYFYKKNKSLSD